MQHNKLISQFTTQQWILHPNDSFRYNTSSHSHPTSLIINQYIKPPSTNPWTKNYKLFLSASNSFDNKAWLLILGIPKDLFCGNKWSIGRIPWRIYKQYKPSSMETHKKFSFTSFSQTWGNTHWQWHQSHQSGEQLSRILSLHLTYTNRPYKQLMTNESSETSQLQWQHAITKTKTCTKQQHCIGTPAGLINIVHVQHIYSYF